MFPNIDMYFFQSQRSPTSQAPGVFMVNQFDSYISVAPFIPPNNEERSQDHQDTLSHGNTSNKALIKLDGEE